MLFSSIPFLFYFFPIVLMVYFAVPFKLKNFVLLISSLFFYGWGEPIYLFLMITTIVGFWCFGLCIEKAKNKSWKKVWLILSVVISLAILGVFKYADFFITNINSVTGLNISLLRLALPIGISFYTFQCLSYTIDIYRGNVQAQKNIINFGAYVAMFPQLIAGPIVRYVDIAKELENREHSVEKFYCGLKRFIVGLSKKIIIANQLGELINVFRDSSNLSVGFYWLYAIAFMLHIYFDFSGYSDMAIGIGKIFGFNFIENFNYPYMSRTVGEFWRRWHMSLGSWFRDYLYIPLGGNRVSKYRWLLNTFIVWIATGIWHGAEWNFVLWGLMYGLLLVFEKFIPAFKKMPSLIGHGYTLFVVMIGFVLFNATNINQALSDIQGLFSFGTFPLISDETVYYFRSYSSVLLIAILGTTPFVKQMYEKLSTSKKTGTIIFFIEPIVVFALLIICTAYLVDGSFNPFLYFRF